MALALLLGSDTARMTPPIARAPADLRTGGSWTPLQRLKNDAIWVVASSALALVRPLRPATLRMLGALLGGIAYAAAGSARRRALDNVASAFADLGPRERRSLVRSCFVALGAALGDTVALLGEHPVPLPPLTGDALVTLQEARAPGRGVVFASAHLAPWELVAASLVAHGVPLVTLARESYDPRLTHVYERLRRKAGVGVVWRGARSASVRMVRELRRGAVLGVPMDLSARVRSHPVRFLGRPAPTPLGPARLALRSGAAVVVGTAAPGPAGGLVVTVTRIPTDDLRADDAGTLELTQRLNEELSRRILALPRAWVWMHDRWTDRGKL